MTYPTKPTKFSLLLCCLLFTAAVSAQVVTKTFDETFDSAKEVNVVQSRGPLTILPSANGKVRVVTTMSVEAKEQEDAEKLLEKLYPTVTRSGDWLNIKTGVSDVKSYTQNNRNIKFVFKNGTRIDGIYNFEINSTIYLPQTQHLALEVRFERIKVDPEVKIKDLSLLLHNGRVSGGSISGNLELDVRFGELELKNVGGSVTGSLHNTKGSFGNVGDVDLDSRFSKLKMGTLKSLKYASHNDRLETGSIPGAIAIDDRFGTYIFGATGNAEITSHNGTFEIESGKEYRVIGRFADFQFDRVDALMLRDNHNCDYEIKSLGNISGEGRFTKIKADKLLKSVELKLENGGFKAYEVGSAFTGIEVDGAFFEVNLNIASSVNYQLFADLRFGDVRLPKDLVTIKQIKDFSALELEMKTSGASANSPVIRVKGQNARLYVD